MLVLVVNNDYRMVNHSVLLVVTRFTLALSKSLSLVTLQLRLQVSSYSTDYSLLLSATRSTTGLGRLLTS